MIRPMVALAAVVTLSLTLVESTAAEPMDVMMDPNEPRVGDIVRVSLRLPTGIRSGEVTFAGKTLPGFDTGGLLNVYLGIDLDTKPGPHEISYVMGEEKGTLTLDVKPRSFETESLAVEKKYTAPDKATQARIEREAKELEGIWRGVTRERLWMKAFVRPATGALGSSFGLRRVFNKKPKSPHAGVDIKAPTGAEVTAANRGKVVLARDLFFTGNTVIIDHGLGLFTVYAHLSRIDVEEGATVERAARIGLVGATGRATGPHLHFGVKLAGARVDPATLPGMML